MDDPNQAPVQCCPLQSGPYPIYPYESQSPCQKKWGGRVGGGSPPLSSICLRPGPTPTGRSQGLSTPFPPTAPPNTPSTPGGGREKKKPALATQRQRYRSSAPPRSRVAPSQSGRHTGCRPGGEEAIQALPRSGPRRHAAAAAPPGPIPPPHAAYRPPKGPRHPMFMPDRPTRPRHAAGSREVLLRRQSRRE